MARVVSEPVALGFSRVARVYLTGTLRRSSLLAVLCWICAAIILANARSAPEIAFGVLAAVFPFVTVGAILTILWRARQAFDVPKTFVVDEPGIDILDERGRSTRVRWEQILSCQEGEREWVFRLTTKGILILPKEAFQGTSLDRVESIVRSKSVS